jgi:hypothetical protein
MDRNTRPSRTIRGIDAGVYLIFAWCEGFALLLMALAVWVVWHFGLALAEVRVEDGTVVGHVYWAVIAAFIFAIAYAVRRFTRWRRALLYKAGSSQS